MNPFTRRLATAAGLVTVVLTAAAFALSYHHLARVAEHNGVTSPIAYWAWPACIDLFIVAGELLILRAVLRAAKDGFAVLLTVVGSVGSIVLNVFGVGMHEPAMSYVVAGVPPFAALLAFGAVMRQIHEVVKNGETAKEAVDTSPTPASAFLPLMDAADLPVNAFLEPLKLVKETKEEEPASEPVKPSESPQRLSKAEAAEIIEKGWRHEIDPELVAIEATRHPVSVRRQYKALDEKYGKPAELAGV